MKNDVLFYLYSLSLWAFTWFKKYRRFAVKGLLIALLSGIAFSYLGYPKSFGILAMSSPIIIFSVCIVWYQWRSEQTHNKSLKRDKKQLAVFVPHLFYPTYYLPINKY